MKLYECMKSLILIDDRQLLCWFVSEKFENRRINVKIIFESMYFVDKKCKVDACAQSGQFAESVTQEPYL